MYLKLLLDASFIILLYDLEYLHLLKTLSKNNIEVIITKQVEYEIGNIANKIKNYEDIKISLGVSVNEDLFRKIKEQYIGLGKGEVSIFSYYLSNTDGDYCCIIDDNKARSVAESLGVIKHGTLWFIETILENEMLSLDEACELLKSIRDTSFRISYTLINDSLVRIGEG